MKYSVDVFYLLQNLLWLVIVIDGSNSSFANREDSLGTADQDEHCKKFMEILIPDAFRKVNSIIFAFSHM